MCEPGYDRGTWVVDSFMVKENNDLIIYTQHCDTYDIVANCNIMLTNKVKNKNIMLHKWFRLNIHRKTQLYQTSYIYIYQSIYSGPLDFDVFEFYCILDFKSKGSYQIASIFDRCEPRWALSLIIEA